MLTENAQELPPNAEGVDLGELLLRLLRGLPQILGLAFIGLVVATLSYLMFSPVTQELTTTRIVFSYDGFDKGLYPDKSKFSAEDVLAPDVIESALINQGLSASPDFQSRIRSALTIEGIIPTAVVKERDQLRATGQTPPIFLPDEYLLSLSLPHKFPLSARAREHLLTAVVDAYRSKFERNYANVALRFGNAFESLKGADLVDYELVLNGESQEMITFLQQQNARSSLFRSPTTNLSFGDLIQKAEIFIRIDLNELLGLIQKSGLSENRELALMRLDYYLQNLADRERKAVEEDKLVQDLLEKASEHAQSYVLGVKTQAAQPRSEAPVLDQGLIDSLLANDAYSFLVHKALESGLAVRQLQSEEAILRERKKRLETPGSESLSSNSIRNQIVQALAKAQASYNKLVDDIRKTDSDYEKQQFSDVIRVSMGPKTASFYWSMAAASSIGLALGFFAGSGLSLLGIYITKRRV